MPSVQSSAVPWCSKQFFVAKAWVDECAHGWCAIRAEKETSVAAATMNRSHTKSMQCKEFYKIFHYIKLADERSENEHVVFEMCSLLLLFFPHQPRNPFRWFALLVLLSALLFLQCAFSENNDDKNFHTKRHLHTLSSLMLSFVSACVRCVAACFRGMGTQSGSKQTRDNKCYRKMFTYFRMHLNLMKMGKRRSVSHLSLSKRSTSYRTAHHTKVIGRKVRWVDEVAFKCMEEHH